MNNNNDDFPFFEDDLDEKANEFLTGDENWDALWDIHLSVDTFGQRMYDILLDKAPESLLEYVGEDSEKKMQYIADNLDLELPNQFLITDMADVVDLWAGNKITADEAVYKLLYEVLPDYFEGC
jgi:hypothetical protein